MGCHSGKEEDPEVGHLSWDMSEASEQQATIGTSSHRPASTDTAVFLWGQRV